MSHVKRQLLSKPKNESSSTITPKAFWQDIGQSNALPIGYAIDFVFPIFESDSSCPQPNSLSESSYKCPMSIPYKDWLKLQQLLHQYICQAEYSRLDKNGMLLNLIQTKLFWYESQKNEYYQVYNQKQMSVMIRRADDQFIHSISVYVNIETISIKRAVMFFQIYFIHFSKSDFKRLL